jgi:hypothetical protein
LRHIRTLKTRCIQSTFFCRRPASYALAKWDNLSLQQRLDTLGQVRNAEIFYQSIGYPVALRADHLNGSPAWYERTKQRITLDANFLQNASAEAAVSAILRACRLIHRDTMLALYDSDPEFYADALFGLEK